MIESIMFESIWWKIMAFITLLGPAIYIIYPVFKYIINIRKREYRWTEVLKFYKRGLLILILYIFITFIPAWLFLQYSAVSVSFPKTLVESVSPASPEGGFIWIIILVFIAGIISLMRTKEAKLLLQRQLLYIALIFLVSLLGLNYIAMILILGGPEFENLDFRADFIAHGQTPMVYGSLFAFTLMLILFKKMHRLNLISIKETEERKATEVKAEYNRKELEQARMIQKGLLPGETLETEYFKAYGASLTADEVGGDYFDYFTLDNGRIAVVIGDVSGHGINSGMVMAMVKASLHTALPLNRTTEEILETLNRVVRMGGSHQKLFLTFCYTILDPNEGIVTCSINGHPFPLLKSRDGTVKEIEAIGYPLGIRENAQVRTRRESFEPGDSLLLYTDGVPEILDQSGHAWGYDALGKHFREDSSGSPDEVVENLLSRIQDHASGRPQDDDFTAVCVLRRE